MGTNRHELCAREAILRRFDNIPAGQVNNLLSMECIPPWQRVTILIEDDLPEGVNRPAQEGYPRGSNPPNASQGFPNHATGS